MYNTLVLAKMFKFTDCPVGKLHAVRTSILYVFTYQIYGLKLFEQINTIRFEHIIYVVYIDQILNI